MAKEVLALAAVEQIAGTFKVSAGVRVIGVGVWEGERERERERARAREREKGGERQRERDPELRGTGVKRGAGRNADTHPCHCPCVPCIIACGVLGQRSTAGECVCARASARARFGRSRSRCSLLVGSGFRRW